MLNHFPSNQKKSRMIFAGISLMLRHKQIIKAWPITPIVKRCFKMLKSYPDLTSPCFASVAQIHQTTDRLVTALLRF